MLPTELDYLARKEQRQDMLRALEKEHLIRMIDQHHGKGQLLHRQTIAWIGGQMVKWGSMLQRYASPSTSNGRAVGVQ